MDMSAKGFETAVAWAGLVGSVVLVAAIALF
jgi:hypothetical protein